MGSTALIAGTTVGAGILALPAVTLPSGILPSTFGLIAVWLYALISGLLIAEVTLNTMRQEGRLGISLLGVVEKTLGKVGARVASSAYLFMHYALLVAYITQGGEILGNAIATFWGMQNLLPTWVGTTAFTLIFGGVMYVGREKFVEKLNSVFVAIVIVSFLGLLLLAGGQVKSSQFLTQNWSALGSAVSVMCVAMFYQNIVPVVVTQLEGDVSKIRRSIFIGSLIPLIMFLAWNAVILASVSQDVLHSTSTGKTFFDPLEILRAGGAGEWLGVLVSVFSEFAIVTSFIGFVYGLLDLFKDIFVIAPGKVFTRLPLYSLVLFPPMTFGTLNPTIFFTALDYTGTFSISVLGGIIPALMTWKQRQKQKNSNSIHQSLVPGGKLTLIAMIAVALFLICGQIMSVYTN
ncbi:tyrosine transporter [Nostoc linckia z18]|uniref:Tyrosine transporter n=2 Tax=Nostoc linckia TaxID=92942 RepID=A0A9Q6ELX9_NOSLI|nr:tyrosine transporter [Nostoc linckia z1]PHJ68090.1 tyrosine transporter [Nostoc linckia z3]PHJ74418.1 tyrosine transporter [Nostoc linckia z2]PHJ80574.1 tyrosine transporter [Nostoc linckia z4]PHJ88122.1 tyrosine transporter [Nostoc linckia z6]PHJ98545.1 tyrosine transporter [Nostoc linckia z7]PHK04843.1 tyrosine transporter [Nostoc linckia z8]PHK11897.1 tyrosine transporter [Nostoc linckia z9]PHK21570.1 tyrosine transporter [Nostoc linckia z14]PHK23980.1 tyrosine transporter [Nostoc li